MPPLVPAPGAFARHDYCAAAGGRVVCRTPPTGQEVSVLTKYDVMCESRCGGDVGYGIAELVIPGSYPKYGF